MMTWVFSIVGLCNPSLEPEFIWAEPRFGVQTLVHFPLLRLSEIAFARHQRWA
jgi:hypothetical protein